ncbi:uncharacterized protein TNCT_622691 [Trichonephila clavata]|uniref:Uncharacterized protein n=1 Tax=Trichonephila clavata TaxID=2740835 RepID=A0A8X6LN19_TRICU|nr:uncharacterized protein TNCT_622691 [Trichonephila clavata]
MWDETEMKKVVYFVPGFAGFAPVIPEQHYSSYGHEDHRQRESCHYEGDRILHRTGFPCVKLEVKPIHLESGDSEYQNCASCECVRNVRPAGLPSNEMWRAMDLEYGGKGKKKYRTGTPGEMHSKGKRYMGEDSGIMYSYYCHGKTQTRNCPHYEGNRRFCCSSKSEIEAPITVTFSVAPRKPKGKFHIPSVYGNYDTERKKLSANICHNLKQKDCHSSHMHHSNYHQRCSNYHHPLNRDYSRKTNFSDRSQSSSSGCRSSARVGGVPNYSGYIAGLFLPVGETFGPATNRILRNSCW